MAKIVRDQKKSWFAVFPTLAKYQKLFRRVIEVGKSEKIIKIGPETAEISGKYPKNGLNSPNLLVFKIGSRF